MAFFSLLILRSQCYSCLWCSPWSILHDNSKNSRLLPNGNAPKAEQWVWRRHGGYPWRWREQTRSGWRLWMSDGHDSQPRVTVSVHRRCYAWLWPPGENKRFPGRNAVSSGNLFFLVQNPEKSITCPDWLLLSPVFHDTDCSSGPLMSAYNWADFAPKLS